MVAMAMTKMTERTGRRTVYCGIEMRSRLEADFACAMDQDRKDVSWKFIWEYEPCCFASPDGQYLPDFHIWTDEPYDCGYFEIKPANIRPIDLDRALARMEIIWKSEPDTWLALVGWKYGYGDEFVWSASGFDRRWRSINHNGSGETIYRRPQRAISIDTIDKR
jgi:hypothetical protein